VLTHDTYKPIARRVLRELRNARTLGQLKTARRYGVLFVGQLMWSSMKATGMTWASIIKNVYEVEKERFA
jgi:hypothetical protein